jgi:hypothetical protein
LYEPNVPEVNAAAVEDGVRRVRQRPLLYGLIVVVFFGFGLWYMTGGSATGSPHQAEQLILTRGGDETFAPLPMAATVHCTQNGQSFIARLYGLVGGGRNAGGRSTAPPTYYTCDGTSTTGQPMYWCVTYPPRMDHLDNTPDVTGRLPNSSCPS